MTDDERRIISEYVQRVAGAAQPAAASASPWGGRAPSVAPTPQLPPVDREADAMIAQLFQQYPEARYRITQTAFVQEHALVQAQNRIQELEWEVENASRQAQAANSRGFLGFGGSRPAAMPPRPMPQYPPGYNAQALQGRQGPGFLGTAMMTAAGVAGGMVLGIVDNLSAAYISTQYRGAVPLFLLIAVILFRPQGLFGRAEERTV
jgi:hypothetical protein